MGILTGRKPKDATTLADPAGGRRDMPQPDAADATQNVASTIADPFSLLPSPPAPCPRCGLAILWIPTTLDAWRCPTCFPPPIRKMVAARVVLVDVDSEFGISPKWQKLEWVERDGRRTIVTTPIRCAANGTALADAAAVGGVAGAAGQTSGAAAEIIQQGGFFIDDSLGPPVGDDGNRLDDDEWFEIGARDVVWNQFFEGRK